VLERCSLIINRALLTHREAVLALRVTELATANAALVQSEGAARAEVSHQAHRLGAMHVELTRTRDLTANNRRR
jgi:hypothetical protein